MHDPSAPTAHRQGGLTIISCLDGDYREVSQRRADSKTPEFPQSASSVLSQQTHGDNCSPSPLAYSAPHLLTSRTQSHETHRMQVNPALIKVDWAGWAEG